MVAIEKRSSFGTTGAIEMGSVQELPELPVFAYEGNGVITRAIADAMGGNGRTGPPGERAVPVAVVGYTDDSSSSDVQAYGGYWVYNCRLDGTTLVVDKVTNLSGILHLAKQDGKYDVFSIEPLDPRSIGSTTLKRFHDPEIMADIVEAFDIESEKAVSVRDTFFGTYAEACSAAGITIENVDFGNGPQPLQ